MALHILIHLQSTWPSQTPVDRRLQPHRPARHWRGGDPGSQRGAGVVGGRPDRHAQRQERAGASIPRAVAVPRWPRGAAEDLLGSGRDRRNPRREDDGERSRSHYRDLERNRKFANSPLEGGGFEPSVPRRGTRLFYVSATSLNAGQTTPRGTESLTAPRKTAPRAPCRDQPEFARCRRKPATRPVRTTRAVSPTRADGAGLPRPPRRRAPARSRC